MFKFELVQNEKLIASYRQSEAALIKTGVITPLAIYIPWYFLLKYELAANFVTWLSLWTAFVLIYALNSYLLWLLNCYLVTNKRLVVIRYKSLLTKQVLEAPLERILNVSYSSSGLMASLFNFGDVLVQTAGLTEPLQLARVSEPGKIKDFIWQIHQKINH